MPAALRRNPTIVPVRFRDIIMPEHYNLFRWQFFRVHFQFVMANERPHAYDFFMIVCGPVPLQRTHGCARSRAGDRDRRRRPPGNGPGKDSKRPIRAPRMPPIWARWNHPRAAAVEILTCRQLSFADPPLGPAGWLWPLL